MSPKSGKAGTAVSPVVPDAAEEAVKGTRGEEVTVQAQPAEKKAHKPLTTPAGGAASGQDGAEQTQEELTWIEIEMVDESDAPVPGVAYSIELPDGSVAEGTLDDKGQARVEQFIKGSGQCKVTFPDLDKEAWEKI